MNKNVVPISAEQYQEDTAEKDGKFEQLTVPGNAVTPFHGDLIEDGLDLHFQLHHGRRLRDFQIWKHCGHETRCPKP